MEQSGIFATKLGRTVKGTGQCVIADNLGAHSIGGFHRVMHMQKDQNFKLEKLEVVLLLEEPKTFMQIN